MSVVLPQELVWVLDAIGIQWPNIDEDSIGEVATECRQIASDLKSGHGDAESEIEQMLGLNSSQALTAFEALWKKLSNGHMQDFITGLGVLADALDVVVGVIVAMKGAAIVQLGVLAAQLLVDQAAAIETLGASELEAASAMEVTRVIVRRIFDEAVQQIEHELLMALAGPVVQALESAGEELATQLVADVAGVGNGIDLSQLQQAAKSGFSQGVSTLKSEGAATLSNPLGAMGSLANGTGLPGGNQTSQMSTAGLPVNQPGGGGGGSGSSSSSDDQGSHIEHALSEGGE